MTELISKDIPIYCIVASGDEVHSQKALTTRDVWTKRFGFTNWNWYERIDRGIRIKNELLSYNDNLLKTMSFRVGIKQYAEAAYVLDLMAIFKKIISNDIDNAIIIGHNTSLKYDIPAAYLQNDISFLRIDEYKRVTKSAGLLVSKEYAIAFIDYTIKTYFANDFTLHRFYIECMKPGDATYKRYTAVKNNCTSNIEDLIIKTDEQMHTIEV